LPAPPHWQERSAFTKNQERKGYCMYIGVGALVAILIIVLIIYFIRRS
jgi:Tfp pilus assembly protein PilN